MKTRRASARRFRIMHRAHTLIGLALLLGACGGKGGDGGEETAPWAPLNDTGVTTCADGTQTGLDCPVDGFPGQDAEYGRDVDFPDEADGRAGFSFVYLDARGQAVDGSGDYACVQDRVTGLVWEVKTDDGLHDRDWTYTWYDGSNGTPGTDADTSCDQGPCDTHAFVQRVNDEALCGFTDWRLPHREELRGILDYGLFADEGQRGLLAKAFFQPTPTNPPWSNARIWTADRVASVTMRTWVIYNFNGVESAVYHDGQTRHAAILVRGGRP